MAVVLWQRVLHCSNKNSNGRNRSAQKPNHRDEGKKLFVNKDGTNYIIKQQISGTSDNFTLITLDGNNKDIGLAYTIQGSFDSDGNITVSEDPGLGVEYDYEYAKKFLVDTLVIDWFLCQKKTFLIPMMKH